MIRIRVKYFAIYRQLLGVHEEELEVPEGTTAGQVFAQRVDHLTKNRDQLVQATLFAINLEYARRDTVLKAEDELVFVPPVSGG